MLTFFTDESYADRGGAEEYKISIYGGLVLNSTTFSELSQFLYKIKDRYVLPQEAEIKWRFRSYWDNLKSIGHIDPSFTQVTKPEAYESFKQDHTAIKEEILNKVAESDAKIIIAIRPNLLLHATDEQVVEYSIGAVARKFEKVLAREGDTGIILADELPRKINPDAIIDHQYILELCCRGSGTVTFSRLLSVVPTINSHVSPIHQVNDVVLGAIQYYVLEFVRRLADPSRNTDTAKGLLGKVSRSFYKDPGGVYTINNGILMYPPKITRKNTPAGLFLNKLEKQLQDDFGII